MRLMPFAVVIAIGSMTLLPGCGNNRSAQMPEVVQPRPANGLVVGPAEGGTNPQAPVAPEVGSP
jgi:hypothetical protein